MSADWHELMIPQRSLQLVGDCLPTNGTVITECNFVAKLHKKELISLVVSIGFRSNLLHNYVLKFLFNFEIVNVHQSDIVVYVIGCISGQLIMVFLIYCSFTDWLKFFYVFYYLRYKVLY